MINILHFKDADLFADDICRDTAYYIETNSAGELVGAWFSDMPYKKDYFEPIQPKSGDTFAVNIYERPLECVEYYTKAIQTARDAGQAAFVGLLMDALEKFKKYERIKAEREADRALPWSIRKNKQYY